MNKVKKVIIFISAFLMVTTISLPIQSFNFIASDKDFTYVTVVDSDGDTRVYKTGRHTVHDFFLEAGITLRDRDLCDHGASDAIWDGMSIHIVRGMDVSVSVNGVWETRRITADTSVEQLLVLLQHEYETALVYDGDIHHEIIDGDRFAFYTWQTYSFTVSEAIPYDTLEWETSAVRDGTSYVRQEGIQGEKEVTTGVVLIGGRESERDTTGIAWISEPIQQIIDIGTGGRLGTKTDTSAPDFHYRKKFIMNASAYTAGYQCTGKNPGDPGYGITASGRHVRPGIVAVDPTIIPLGTHLYVEGYGFSIAADVGSAIKGYKIDLYIEGLEDALRFGRRNLMVYILD
jgi:3D (Asp-Asp-Asp) domain-containing protein